MPAAPFQDPILTIAEPETLADPYPYYARLREQRPVFFYDRLGSWMFSRYAECAAVLKDPAHFAADWRRVGERVPPRAVNMLTLDPPEHTSVRRLFLETLREQDGQAVRRMLQTQTVQLLEVLSARESFDLVTELAEPLALSTTAAYLGVEPPDAAWSSRIGRAIGAGMDAGLWPDRGPAVAAAHEELADLVDGWLADPPDAGIVGSLTGRIADCEVAPDVLANTVRGLLFSGFSSGSKLLGLAMVAALHGKFVGLADIRAADPVRATDELVRFAGPIQAVARACVADTDVGGTLVRAGQAVTLLLGAANRDPERFPDPETVQLDRHPNPHLGFGRGVKSCLGSPFTAVFAQVVFGTLAERFPDAHAVGVPSFHPNLTLRSLDRFEIALR